jgi:hypothetical protein
MDTPQPEEDDVDFAMDPLDVIEHVLSAENLTFDRTEDGDLALRPEADCLQLCLSMDIRAKKTRRQAAHTMLSLINQRVWLGHFEVWSDDGEVVFRHAMALPTGERPTLAQAASMIDAAVEAADRFYPAFDFLVQGSKSPQEAIAACMFETLGEA